MTISTDAKSHPETTLPFESRRNDPVFGHISVSAAAKHGAWQVTVDVGEAMTISLSPSESEYKQIREVLFDARGADAAPHSLLFPLAALCAELSVPQQVVLNDCSIASMLSRGRIPREQDDAYRGLVAWVPEPTLEDSNSRLYEDCTLSPALLLRLRSIIESEDTFWRETALRCVAEGCDEMVGYIDHYFKNLPSSATEPLIRLAVEQGSPFVPAVLRQAVRAAGQGATSLSESSKLTIIRTVQQVTGINVLFSSDWQHSEHQILLSELNRALKLPEGNALVSCLHEIPKELVEHLPESKALDWMGHWGSFTEDAKAHLIRWVQNQPEILVQRWRSIDAIPAEIARVLASDGVIDRLLADSNSLQTIARHLTELRDLPGRAFERLKEVIPIDELIKSLSSFRLTIPEKKLLISETTATGKIALLIPQLMNFPDVALQGVSPPGDQLISFKRDCKLLLPEVYDAYREAYNQHGKGAAKQLAEEAWELLGQIVSPRPLSTEAREHPLFDSLMRYGYPNNSSAANDAYRFCEDQSDDLDLFEIPQEPVELQLLAGGTIALRRGLTPEHSVVQRVEKLTREPLRLAAESAGKENAALAQRARELLATLSPESAEVPPEVALVTVLEKAWNGELNLSKIKSAAVSYHAFADPNFAAQAMATRARIQSAPNADYAKLCELREFLTTSVVDSLRAVVRAERTGAAAETLLRFLPEIFTEEIEAIDKEIAKYSVQGADGKETRTVTAFFSKNKQSAAMRQVAGVCVADDNPDPDTLCRNIWEMENYMQLVLRDERTRRCVGGALLHYYEEQDKRILTASLNPSSTLLYKIDERALFDELTRVLGEFASLNDIDLIAVSRDPAIRTNRTGGIFEQALNTRIRLVNEQFSLDAPQVFSFEPSYEQQELDIIWRREEG